MKRIIAMATLAISFAAFAGGALQAGAEVGLLVCREALKCASDKKVEPNSIRGRQHSFCEKEGLALSRIVSAPLNVLEAPVGMIGGFCTDETRGVGKKVCCTPLMLVGGLLYGAFGSVDEIGIGLFEVFTGRKAKNAYYPWETYSVTYRAIQERPEPLKEDEK